MTPVLIGIRSNLMEGLKPIEEWLDWAQSEFQAVQLSNIYRTEGQALNRGWLSELWAVVRIETELTYLDSAQLKTRPEDSQIESTLLAWGSEVLLNPIAPLPNPNLHRQRVFLQCSAELEPKLVHPILGQSLVELVNLEQRPLDAEFFAQGRRTLNKG